MEINDREDVTYYLEYANADLTRLKVLKLYASDSLDILPH